MALNWKDTVNALALARSLHINQKRKSGEPILFILSQSLAMLLPLGFEKTALSPPLSFMMLWRTVESQ